MTTGIQVPAQRHPPVKTGSRYARMSVGVGLWAFCLAGAGCASTVHAGATSPEARVSSAGAAVDSSATPPGYVAFVGWLPQGYKQEPGPLVETIQNPSGDGTEIGVWNRIYTAGPSAPVISVTQMPGDFVTAETTQVPGLPAWSSTHVGDLSAFFVSTGDAEDLVWFRGGYTFRVEATSSGGDALPPAQIIQRIGSGLQLTAAG
jgi:hypothetical protein